MVAQGGLKTQSPYAGFHGNYKVKLDKVQINAMMGKGCINPRT